MPQISPVVANLYRQMGSAPIGYIDETYSVDPHHGLQFYVMVAVVVKADQRDLLRDEIRKIAGTHFWHTTDQIRDRQGYLRTRELLTYLGDPEGQEICVVSHVEAIEPGDIDGEEARARCFTGLIGYLASDKCPAGPISALLLERRRERTQANRDADTRAKAIANGLAPPKLRLLQVTPSDENLLWLPDLVCSAYRQHIARNDTDLFNAIRAMTVVIGPE